LQNIIAKGKIMSIGNLNKGNAIDGQKRLFYSLVRHKYEQDYIQDHKEA